MSLIRIFIILISAMLVILGIFVVHVQLDSYSTSPVSVQLDKTNSVKKDLGTQQNVQTKTQLERQWFVPTSTGVVWVNKTALTFQAQNRTRDGLDKKSKAMAPKPVQQKVNASTKGPKSESDEALVERLTTMLKERLRRNTTIRRYAVGKKCPPHSKSHYACIAQNCTQLSSDPAARVRSLFSSPKTRLTEAQHEIIRSMAAKVPEDDIILLTAASANHFNEGQALFQSLHKMVYPNLKNFTVVLWDLGLSKKQHEMAKKCCNCTVIRFPFEKFDREMRQLRCYRWKPLVIRATLLRARRFAVWQDVSIRFKKFPGPLFERGEAAGIHILRRRTVGVSIPHRTLPETFAYLGQNICPFYQFPETASGYAVYKNDPFVIDAISDPWARCGFEAKCMCPKHYYHSYHCVYGPCHRFDQSALGIIAHTLYAQQIYKILIVEEVDMRKYFAVARSQKLPNYFNSTGCLAT